MKNLYLSLLLAAIAGTLAALTPSDPQDPVYRDLARWEAQGLTGFLPALKPYNITFLKSVLEKVSQGSGQEAAAAASYLKEITSKPELSLSRTVGSVNASLNGGEAGGRDFFLAGGQYLGTNSVFNEWSSISGFFGALAVDQGNSRTGTGTAIPSGFRSPFDYYVDDSSLDIADRVLLLTLSMGGNVSIGSPDLWFQGGLHRSTFGPFTEGVVLSEQAPQAAAFSFTWNTPNLIYTKYLLGISATEDNRSFYGSFQDYYPDKYLSGQSFQFLLGDSLELSLFEEVVFGQRLEPYYLAPVISSLYTSIYTGMKDNILVGGSARWRLPGNFVLSGLFHADDMHFLKLLMLDTSGKTKIGVQGGVEWVPAQSWLDSLSLDYALATPYTFTHAVESIDGVYSEINYVNYTHQGKGLSGLEPNSDRLRIKAAWTGGPLWTAWAEGRLSRHGNASADFPEYGTISAPFVGTSDGGFNDNGYVSPGGDHRYNSNHFLTQSVIETLWRTTVGGDVTLPVLGTSVKLGASYALEMGWNRRTLGEVSVPGWTDDSSTDVDESAGWKNGGTPKAGNDGLVHYINLNFRMLF